jgi:hypothetical protein
MGNMPDTLMPVRALTNPQESDQPSDLPAIVQKHGQRQEISLQ